MAKQMLSGQRLAKPIYLMFIDCWTRLLTTSVEALDPMSPPLLGVDGDGQGQGNVNGALLTERNYLGLSDCSSVDSTAVSGINLNLKATELRLGLPGSQSPERDADSDNLDEKQLFPLLPSKDGICLGSQKIVGSGSKRGFADTIEGNWMFGSSGTDSDVQGKFTSNANVNVRMTSGAQPAATKDAASKVAQSLNKVNGSGSGSGSNPPAAKAQVVGWPPVRSYRKNILATNAKNNDEVDGKPGLSALFVKVSMDGAPYLRKVDLRSYKTYQELSSALEKMFSCFTLGQCGSQGGSGKESLSESKLRDLLHGSEYVLTYEDKDGDWMLVGDVPWDMFIGSCKKLKIMKGSDAIGLAPRAMEKSKNRN